MGNFRIQPVANNVYNHYTGKLDHRLASKDSLMARWTYRRVTRSRQTENLLNAHLFFWSSRKSIVHC